MQIFPIEVNYFLPCLGLSDHMYYVSVYLVYCETYYLNEIQSQLDPSSFTKEYSQNYIISAQTSALLLIPECYYLVPLS